MSINLPRPPEADLFRADPQRFVSELISFLNRLIAELERDARDATTPAKAVFALTNNTTPSTTLDVAAGSLGDVRNFLGGLVGTLNRKGILRTKAGAE